MLYTTLTIDGTDYRCRLDAKSCVDLEKKIGTNPVNIFTKVGTSKEVPSLTVLLTVLHASLQAYEHGIKMDDVYVLYDKYIEEGHTMMDLIPLELEIFKNSGFFVEDNDQKN